jgi:hypothetical protein
MKSLLPTIAALALTSAAPAAQVTVVPTYVGYYSPDFNTFTPATPFGINGAYVPNAHLQFDFFLNVSGLAPNQSEAFVLFDVTLGPYLARDSLAPDYLGNNSAWSTGTGSGRSGTKFINNADQGASDLKAIFANSTVKTAAQLNLGESSPENLGTIFVQLPGGPIDDSFIATSPIAGDTWGTWDNITIGGPPNFTAAGTQTAQATGFVPTSTFLPLFVPEPALPIPAATLLALHFMHPSRRRTLRS